MLTQRTVQSKDQENILILDVCPLGGTRVCERNLLIIFNKLTRQEVALCVNTFQFQFLPATFPLSLAWASFVRTHLTALTNGSLQTDALMFVSNEQGPWRTASVQF